MVFWEVGGGLVVVGRGLWAVVGGCGMWVWVVVESFIGGWGMDGWG